MVCFFFFNDKYLVYCALNIQLTIELVSTLVSTSVKKVSWHKGGITVYAVPQNWTLRKTLSVRSDKWEVRSSYL